MLTALAKNLQVMCGSDIAGFQGFSTVLTGFSMVFDDFRLCLQGVLGFLSAFGWLFDRLMRGVVDGVKGF